MVRAPALILPCRNCAGPLRADLKPKLDHPTALTLTLRCEAGCGVDEAFVVAPTVKPKGKA